MGEQKVYGFGLVGMWGRSGRVRGGGNNNQKVFCEKSFQLKIQRQMFGLKKILSSVPSQFKNNMANKLSFFVNKSNTQIRKKTHKPT